MSAPVLVPPKTRAQQVRSFDVTDFPALTGREEEWRFTPLKRLRGLAAATAGPGATAPAVEAGALPEGVTVVTVDRSDPRVGSALTPFDRISALAAGSATEALLVSVAPDTVPATAAVVRLVGSTTEIAYGHTVVEVGRLAEATVVLEQVGTVTLADNVEVIVGDAARLTLVTVTDWAADRGPGPAHPVPDRPRREGHARPGDPRR